MARWRITNIAAGVILGTYEGTTEAEALDALARDAGYTDYAEADAVGKSNAGELRVERIE